MLHNVDYRRWIDMATTTRYLPNWVSFAGHFIVSHAFRPVVFVCMDSEERLSGEGAAAESSFEAGIRQQRELMQQMAGRENWEGESQFTIQMRRLGGAAMYVMAFAGVAFIVWAIAYVVLNS
jgi:hypothetical protein